MDKEQSKTLKKLWLAAYNPINSKLTAAEYKDPVLGLILLRFAQNSLMKFSQKIIANLPVNYNTERKQTLKIISRRPCLYQMISQNMTT